MARRGRKKAPVNIPICLAIILLFLTLISLRLSGGIVARYTTTTDSGDSARVIRFGDITLELIDGIADSNVQYVYPGAELTWNAKVSFEGSESATYVFVDVKGVAAADVDSVTPIAGGPSWTVDTVQWTAVDADKYPGVYYIALAPNVTLTDTPLFTDGGVVKIPDTLTVEGLADLFAAGEIEASFRASVLQSNGFDSADSVVEAWESLESKHK